MFKKPFAVVTALFIFLLAAGQLCYGDKPAVPNIPQITIPENSFDFGSVPQGSKLTHKFVIKNTGEAPLQLISAKGS